MSTWPAVRAWIWVSVIASSAGWVLSWLHALTRTGYVAFFVIAAAIAWASFRFKPLHALFGLEPQSSPAALCCRTSRRALRARLRRRFRRPFPMAWAGLTFLVLVGAIIYSPNNHTALSYRIPRSLQWIFHHGWFWIHSPDARVNDRACGLEWLSTPILLFTKSDRLLFVVNFIPYLFLPALIFSLWRHLGVRPRVAYYWMWLLPGGYVFLLQAGSTGNDTFPVVYLLAAMLYAVQAHQRSSITLFWYSVFAAALALGAKPTCLPLMLPWALLIIPGLRRFLKGFGTARSVEAGVRYFVSTIGYSFATLCFCAIALLVSFFPNALLNIHYCGDWTGASIENAGLAVKNPLTGIWGNAFLLTLKNFLPPLFPWAGWWNQHAPEVLPQAMVHAMERSFEPASHVVGEIPTEEWAGLGFGISVLLLISVCAVPFIRRNVLLARVRAGAGPRTPRTLNPPFLPKRLVLAVLASFWIALIGFSSKSGMVDAARLATPYYPFICCTLLVGAAQSDIVRRRWWRFFAWCSLALALMVLIIVPSRPLFPARALLGNAAAAHPNSRALQRALNVYTVFGERSDPLANVRALLPPHVHLLGFLGTEDDIDISLWRPFFDRRLEYVLPADSAESIRARGLRYVVAGGYQLQIHKVPLEDWLKQVNAEVIAETAAIQKLAEGPQPWYIVVLK